MKIRLNECFEKVLKMEGNWYSIYATTRGVQPTKARGSGVIVVINKTKSTDTGFAGRISSLESVLVRSNL